MPAYLCHICKTYNPFPSPLCQKCAHAYCIICLPLVPESSPPPLSLSSSTCCNTSISSLTLDTEAAAGDDKVKDEEDVRQKIMREMMHIHPAHRITHPPSPERKSERVPLLSPAPRRVSRQGMVVDAATLPASEAEHDNNIIGSEPLPTPSSSDDDLHSPLVQESLPLTSFALFAPVSMHVATLVPPTPAPIPPQPALSHPQSSRRELLPTQPPHPPHPPPPKPQHKQRTSIPEIITIEGDHLRRTMSAQGEKVKGLVRKGSLRLREAMSGRPRTAHRGARVRRGSEKEWEVVEAMGGR